MFHPLPVYIGLRYTRAKRRNHFISFISLISMLGIMLGIVALVVVLSVMNGFHKEIQERILGMASHATIQGANGELQGWPAVLEQAEQHPAVVGAAPFVEIQGMLTNGQEVSGAILRGIRPDLEDRVAAVREHMKRGSLDDLQPGSFNVVLGRDLAYTLGVGPGDKVTVVTPQVSVTPVGVMPRLKRLTVSGLFEVGMAEYDRGAGFLNIEDAAKLAQLEEGITGVRLKLRDLFGAPEVSRELAAGLSGLYRVTDWTQHHRNFFAALRMEKRMMSIILFLIVAVAAFNIVSTLVMVVTDKRSDIAILRTLGISPSGIMGIFMVQGASIGLAGTLLGALGGVLLALNLEPIVAWIERVFNVHFLDPGIYYISQLPSDLHWSDVGLISLSALVMSLMATLYPAWRASRTDPAEALRYE
jgi:lipoprotein-releasing system permease protein